MRDRDALDVAKLHTGFTERRIEHRVKSLYVRPAGDLRNNAPELTVKLDLRADAA